MPLPVVEIMLHFFLSNISLPCAVCRACCLWSSSTLGPICEGYSFLVSTESTCVGYDYCPNVLLLCMFLVVLPRSISRRVACPQRNNINSPTLLVSHLASNHDLPPTQPARLTRAHHRPLTCTSCLLVVLVSLECR